MQKKYILIISTITLCLNLAAQQNVGIGTTSPNESAILDVSSTTKGVLVPRMTAAQRMAIASPAMGLMAFDIDSSSFAYYNGTNWMFVKGKNNNANNWSSTGNAGMVDSTNFIGTTDNVPFTIRVNNQQAGRIEKDGSVLLGYKAGINIYGGSWNTGIGNEALRFNTDGTANTAIGYQALFYNLSGYQNTATGMLALTNNGGNDNTATGYAALSSNSSGNRNTAIGSEALFSNGTGFNNTASGSGALHENLGGSNNTASGLNALYNNSSGNQNTAIGQNALLFNTTGNQNTAMGSNVMVNSSGNQNTAMGFFALNNSAGNNNTGIGYSAGKDITTGSNNIVIGNNAQVPTPMADNQVRIGNTAITYAGVQVAWTITSDKRWKSDIEPSDLGLDFISKLKPVSYTRNNDESKKREYGFIAQELEEALNEAGATDNGMISKDDNGMYGVRYNDLMSPMVKAIQEQQSIIDIQSKKLSDLQTQIDELKKLVKENN